MLLRKGSLVESSKKSGLALLGKKLLIINSQISEFKAHSQLLSFFYVFSFFIQWTISIFYVIQNYSDVIEIQGDLFGSIATQYINNFLTFQGVANTFNIGSAGKLVRGLNVFFFLVSIVYCASICYIWLKEVKEISYVLRFPYHIANFMHSIFPWVLLQPILAILLTTISLEVQNFRDATFLGSYALVGLDLMIAVINIIVYLFIFINSSLFYIEINVDSKDQLAGMASDHKLQLMVFRTVVILFQIYLQSNFNILFILNAILAIMLILNMITKNICYNMNITKAFIIGSSFLAVLNILCLIQSDQGKIDFVLWPVLYSFFISGFLAKVLIIIKENREFKLYKYFNDEIEKPYQFLHYISNLLCVLSLKKLTPEQEFLELTILGHHSVNCRISSCYCKSFIKIKTEKYSAPIKLKGIRPFNQSEAKLVTFTGRRYDHFLKKFPKDQLLNASYSYFLMNFVGNVLKSIMYLMISKSKADGLTQKYFVFKQMQAITTHMNEINDDRNEFANRLEIHRAIEINKHFDKLVKLFQEALQVNLNFFQELLDDKQDFQHLLGTIQELHTLCNDVKHTFQKIYSNSTHHLGSLLLYGLFEKTLLNRTENNSYLMRGQELRTHLMHKNFLKQSFEQLEDILIADAAVLVASGDKTKYGKLTYANKSLCRYFGYGSGELTNENLTRLIPNMIALHHEKYMREYENRGGGQFFKMMRNLFGKHKEGFIFPIHSIVKPLFNTKNGLEYLGLIRKKFIDKRSQYILTTESGQIDSVSKDLMQRLYLTPLILSTDIITIDKYIKNIKLYYENLMNRLSIDEEDNQAYNRNEFRFQFDTELIISAQIARKTIEKIRRRLSFEDKERGKEKEKGRRKGRRQTKKIKPSTFALDSPRSQNSEISVKRGSKASLNSSFNKDYTPSKFGPIDRLVRRTSIRVTNSEYTSSESPKRNGEKKETAYFPDLSKERANSASTLKRINSSKKEIEFLPEKEKPTQKKPKAIVTRNSDDKLKVRDTIRRSSSMRRASDVFGEGDSPKRRPSKLGTDLFPDKLDQKLLMSQNYWRNNELEPVEYKKRDSKKGADLIPELGLPNALRRTNSIRKPSEGLQEISLPENLKRRNSLKKTGIIDLVPQVLKRKSSSRVYSEQFGEDLKISPIRARKSSTKNSDSDASELFRQEISEDYTANCLCKLDRLDYASSKEMFIVVELANLEYSNIRMEKAATMLTPRSQRGEQTSTNSGTIEHFDFIEQMEEMKPTGVIISSAASSASVESSTDLRARNMYINKFIEEFNLGKLHIILYWMVWMVFGCLFFLLYINLNYTSSLDSTLITEFKLIGLYLPSRTYPFQLTPAFNILMGNEQKKFTYVSSLNVEYYSNIESSLLSTMTDLTNYIHEQAENNTFDSALYDQTTVSNLLNEEIYIPTPGSTYLVTYYNNIWRYVVKLKDLPQENSFDMNSTIFNWEFDSYNIFYNFNSEFNQLVRNSYNFEKLDSSAEPYIIGVVNPSIIAEIGLLTIICLLVNNVIFKGKSAFKSMILLQPYCQEIYNLRRVTLESLKMIQKELDHQNRYALELKSRETPYHLEKGFNRLKTIGAVEYRGPKIKIFTKEFSITLIGAIVILILNISLDIATAKNVQNLSESFDNILSIQSNLAESYFLLTTLIGSEISNVMLGYPTFSQIEESFIQWEDSKTNLYENRQKVISQNNEISSLFESNFCDSMIFNTEMNLYCKQVYSGIGTQGFWRFEASMNQEVTNLYILIKQNNFTWSNSSEQLLVDLTYSNCFLTEKLMELIWSSLEAIAQQNINSHKSESIMFITIDIVIISIFFLYNAIVIRKLTNIGAAIKRALRFFPDAYLIKNRAVISNISATSSNKYKSLIKKKTALMS